MLWGVTPPHPPVDPPLKWKVVSEKKNGSNESNEGVRRVSREKSTRRQFGQASYILFVEKGGSLTEKI